MHCRLSPGGSGAKIHEHCDGVALLVHFWEFLWTKKALLYDIRWYMASQCQNFVSVQQVRKSLLIEERGGNEIGISMSSS
jgi:hypothetical protein